MGRAGSTRTALAVIVATLVLGGAAAMAQEPPKPSDNWLLDAKDDAERFRRIQQMFGGFSAAMLIVGERYDRTFDAVSEGNHDLALYHWKKIKEAIELGYLRRPAREANSVALFLKDPWTSVGDALASKNSEKAKEAFLSARLACLACHLAERVPFMNDQPRFRKTAAFPDR